jgi:hypothetical protein
MIFEMFFVGLDIAQGSNPLMTKEFVTTFSIPHTMG